MATISNPALPMQATDGVLLVGHGTRDAGGVADFICLAERVRGLLLGGLKNGTGTSRQRGAVGPTHGTLGASPLFQPTAVEPCFLELAEPTIAEGIARLIGGGVQRITVVPLLLTAAGHAKRDIPTAVDAALSGHQSITVRQTAALDWHPLVVDLSMRRYDEALAGRAAVPPEQTLLLFVGRGSSDAGAVATVGRFAALRAEQSAVGRVETCFAAVARPSLEEMLPVAAGAGFGRIVVQPHLLFRGRLLEDIRGEVARSASGLRERGRAHFAHGQSQNEPVPFQTEWIVAEPLGPEPELADAVVDIIRRLDGSTTAEKLSQCAIFAHPPPLTRP